MPGILRGLPLFPRLSTRPLLPLSRGISPLGRSRVGRPSFVQYFSISRPRLTSSPSPSPSPSRTPPLSSSSEPPQTLSGRLKLLIKSYGWYALGVYFVFSTLDFGVAFIAINLLGADQVAYMAASIKSFFFDLIGRTPTEHPGEPDSHSTGGSEGLYAMIVLAYTVHKTLFLPIRVGLTAAFTPKLVGWLGRRGWVGADGARRAGREIRERVRRGSRESNSPGDSGRQG
ncbi:hypothetical protein JB92DRAFT_2920337 [Gautieria morchelliformis]|nr:hypothetical protein JB92DRAFT_2920337 [Gautieria morchelliformis]